MRLLALVLTLLISACASFGDGSAFGGGVVRDKQVSDSTYVVSAFLNGHTHPAALKPSILRRANDIATKSGFTDFEIEDVTVQYSQLNNGFQAVAHVTFSRSGHPPIPGLRYLTSSDEVRLYDEKFDATRTSGLARVASKVTNFEGGVSLLMLHPVFVDAVGATGGFLGGSGTAYLRPGRHRFEVFARVVPSMFADPRAALVTVEALLAPNASYALAGRFSEGTLTYWLEDSNTKQPVNSPRSARLSH